MKNHDLYDARCAVIAQFGQDIATASNPALRMGLTTVLLTWQRWTSEDYFAPNPNITMDWTGPLDMVADFQATGLDASKCWQAAQSLTELDNEVLRHR